MSSFIQVQAQGGTGNKSIAAMKLLHWVYNHYNAIMQLKSWIWTTIEFNTEFDAKVIMNKITMKTKNLQYILLLALKFVNLSRGWPP